MVAQGVDRSSGVLVRKVGTNEMQRALEEMKIRI
jgi:hypothetical protein